MDKPDLSIRSWIIFFLTVTVLAGVAVLAWYLGSDYAEGAHLKLKTVQDEVARLQERADGVGAEVDESLADALTKARAGLSAEQARLITEIAERFDKRMTAYQECCASITEAKENLQKLQGEQASVLASLKSLQKELGQAQEIAEDLKLPQGVDSLPDYLKQVQQGLARQVGESETRMRGQIQRAQLDVLPVGTVLPWDSRVYVNRRHTGRHRGIPQGWKECDGSDGTPDLRGLLLGGARNAQEVGKPLGQSEIPRNGRHYHHAGGTEGVRAPQDGDVYVQGASRKAADTYWFEPHGEHGHPGYQPRHVRLMFIMKVSN